MPSLSVDGEGTRIASAPAPHYVLRRQVATPSPGGSRTEPESDGGGGDGAVEDIGALVVSDGPVGFEPVDRPLDLVAALVEIPVEAGGTAALGATAPAVGSLILRFGDRVLDLPSSQVFAVAA